MDNSGRVFFPKTLRKRLGLTPEIELEAVEQPGGLLLRPLMQNRRCSTWAEWIHQGAADPAANWEGVLNDIREERIQVLLKP